MTSVNFGVRFSKINNSVLSSTFRVFLSWFIFLQLSKHLLAQGVDKKGSGALTIMFKDYILFFYLGTSLTVKIFSIWALLLSRWPLRPILSVKTNVVARNVFLRVGVCVRACVWRRIEEVFMIFLLRCWRQPDYTSLLRGKLEWTKRQGNVSISLARDKASNIFLLKVSLSNFIFAVERSRGNPLERHILVRLSF